VVEGFRIWGERCARADALAAVVGRYLHQHICPRATDEQRVEGQHGVEQHHEAELLAGHQLLVQRPLPEDEAFLAVMGELLNRRQRRVHKTGIPPS
jgi:hypothetical protein